MNWFGQELAELPEPRSVVKLQPHHPLLIKPTSAELFYLKSLYPGARNPEKLVMRIEGERRDRASLRHSWDIVLNPDAAAMAEHLVSAAVSNGQVVEFEASGFPPSQHITVSVLPLQAPETPA